MDISLLRTRFIALRRLVESLKNLKNFGKKFQRARARRAGKIKI
jgi:hypothetical protein